MRSDQKVMFVCDDCGAEFARWSGQCPNCGSYMTLSHTKKGDFCVCANEQCKTRIPAPESEE